MKLFATLIFFFLFCFFTFSQNISEHAQIDTVFVKGGTFTMGSQGKEKYRSKDEIQHKVNISDFFISTTEITHAQYIQFMNDIGVNSKGSYNGIEYVDMDDQDCAIKYINGSFTFSANYFIQSENFPMTEVTWAGAVAYTKRAGGRLPTEAEWEYAARGGAMSKGYLYAGSDTTRKVAVFRGTSKRKMKAVATMKSNELDLFDMSGCVWEWCSDWYAPYDINSQSDPKGELYGKFRVIRGGSWNCYGEDCRVAYRGNRNPAASSYDCGFRIVYDK